MMNWALQLNIDQSGNSFNNHLEKQSIHFGSSKPTQSPKPIEDRTGQPVTQEIVGKLQEELISSDRPEKPETKEEQHVRNHDGSGKTWWWRKNAPNGETFENEENVSWKVTMERRNLWKEERLHKMQEDGFSKIVMTRISFTLRWMTRTLILTSPVFPMRWCNVCKALAFMTWFKISKVIHNENAIMAAGNNELCDIINVEPKSQCRASLTHWSAIIVYFIWEMMPQK